MASKLETVRTLQSGASCIARRLIQVTTKNCWKWPILEVSVLFIATKSSRKKKRFGHILM